MTKPNETVTPAAPAAPATPQQGVLIPPPTETPTTTPETSGETADANKTEAVTQETTKTEQTTPDEKPAEAKATEAAPDIKLTLPDGVAADDALLKEFVPLAKELGIKQEGAQKVADLYFRAQKQAVQAAQQHWAKQDEGWKEAAKKDKEFGGDKFDANVKVAQKAIRQFATQDFLKALSESGLSNHPEMVRFCYRVGKALADDSVAGTTASGANGAQQISQEELLRRTYPSMFKQKE